MNYSDNKKVESYRKEFSKNENNTKNTNHTRNNSNMVINKQIN